MISFWMMLVALVLGGMLHCLYRTWRGIGLRQVAAISTRRGRRVVILLNGFIGNHSRIAPGEAFRFRPGPNIPLEVRRTRRWLRQ